MLMQNFKTATELHLTDIEFNALRKVLGMLEREELEHVPLCGNAHSAYGFNMGMAYAEYSDCDTVACIAGWAHIASGYKAFCSIVSSPFRFRKPKSSELEYLFYPSRNHDAMCAITPTQAATALRNYLVTGAPQWKQIL